MTIPTKDRIKEVITDEVTRSRMKDRQAKLFLFVDNDSEVLILRDYQNIFNKIDVLGSLQAADPNQIKHRVIGSIFVPDIDDYGLFVSHSRIQFGSLVAMSQAHMSARQYHIDRIFNEYPREKPYNHFYDAITELDEFVDDVYDCMLLEAI